MTNPKRLLSLFVAFSLFFTQTAQAYSFLAWQSQSGSGHYTETVNLANIKAGTLRQAQGERSGLSVDATGGVIVDIPEVAAAPAPAANGLIAAPVKPPLTDKETAQAEAVKKVQDAQRLKDHLNTLAKQPGQEWLAQLAKDPKLNVQFKQVSAAAQQWNYSHDGLTPEAAGVIVIVVTYFTAGAASGAAGAITGAAAGTTTIASAALAAGMTALASQASLALINNKGDLGKTLDDMGKSENVKALVTAMVTAGVMQGVGGTDFMQAHQGLGFSDTAIRNLTNAAVRTSMNVAINGGSLQDQLGASLQNALVDTLSAQGEHALHLSPDQAQQLNAQITSKLGHALLGCATAGAKHQDCASGALGDVTGEVVGELLLNGRDPLFLTPKEKQDIKDKTKVLAAVVGFGAGLNPDTAAAAGLNAVENNALFRGADGKLQAVKPTADEMAAHYAGLGAGKPGEAVYRQGSDVSLESYPNESLNAVADGSKNILLPSPLMLGVALAGWETGVLQPGALTDTFIYGSLNHIQNLGNGQVQLGTDSFNFGSSDNCVGKS
jgi:hypothetical protein